MDEGHANVVAKALGGLAWQLSGEEWVVLFERIDGKVVVVSDESIREYNDMGAFEDAKSIVSIMLH